MRRSVSIVILTWNALEYTRRCLESLRRNTTFENYSVIVVDNGSRDGTVEYLRSLPWVRMIENESNLGFTRGNNLGIAASTMASDVILLNNDTEVHQGDWIQRLQRAAESSPDVGIVGCRLRSQSGILLHAGTVMPPTYFGVQIGSGEKDVNQFSDDREVEGVVFACVYVKREVIEAVGPLDEEYFSYFEDTDYCLKALEHGYRTLCCGGVTLIHHERISTTANRVRFGEIYVASQAVFRRKWEGRLEAKRYVRRVGWQSLLSFVNGYAISSRNLVLALDRQGVEVSYRYAYGPGSVVPLEEPKEADSYLVSVLGKRTIDPKDAQVVFAWGNVLESNFGSYKIGFSMLETDGIPEEWARQANLMDEVWVPTSFNVETFRNSGVTRPLHVIPLGIDPNYFNPDVTSFHPKNAFVFLSVFEWGERKAPEILLKAFNDEFQTHEDAVLVCRIQNRDPDLNVPEEVKGLRLREGGGRVLFSLNEVIPFHQAGALYRSADCFVLSTRGEGWGMPILEAMACGLPVIATDWGASRDFMNESNAYLLKVDRLVPAVARCPYYDGFRWAEPSYEHLRVLMRYVYEHRDEAKAKGLEASRQALTGWTWEHSARRIISRLDSFGGPISRQ